MALDFDATYTPRSNVADANYSFGSFKNRITPLTGTPFDKAWANDILGFHQKLLDFANITPSNVPDTVLASDYFDGMVKRINQLSQYLVDSGAADAYVVSGDPAYTAYFAGMKMRVKISNVNTGASTLNVDSLGAKNIVQPVNTPLIAGDLLVGAIVELEYDGTNFQLMDHARKFGAWDHGTFAVNTTYLAATDLIVHSRQDNVNVTITGLTDGSSPPTTTVCSDTSVSTAAGACVTFAVKRGDFWRVECSGPLDNLSVIPLS